VSKLASPSGFPKAHLSLTRVGQATARRQALHVIRLYEPRTELRCSLKGSVPLAGSLPSRPTSPFGSVDCDRCYVNYEGYCARDFTCTSAEFRNPKLLPILCATYPLHSSPRAR
jgi:hypothetical protein